MNIKHLLAFFLLLSFSQIGVASEPVLDVALNIKTMRLEEGGILAPLDLDREDAVKWLREAIASGQKRLSAELPPSVFGGEKTNIELVSVPHPDIQSTVNKLFVQWKHEINAASFIPLVGRAVQQKLNVFVALEVRASSPGQPPMVFPGQARKEVEYKKGLLPASAFAEALEQVGRQLFDEAIGNAIAAANGTQKVASGQ